jgi:dihydroorotate dehydrogenase
MSSELAQGKFDAGADLIQLITGIIYEGPSLIKKMCKKVRPNLAALVK